VPVIAVTANARREQINSAIEAGMDEVVTKPFRIPELVPQMRKLVAEVLGRACSLMFGDCRYFVLMVRSIGCMIPGRSMDF
jgi:DNA-binding response OmpR family regulator